MASPKVIAIAVIGIVVMIFGVIALGVGMLGFWLILTGVFILLWAYYKNRQESMYGKSVYQPVYGSQPPPPPQSAPQPAPTCADCGRPLNYVQQYGRWYCYNCQKYV